MKNVLERNWFKVFVALCVSFVLFTGTTIYKKNYVLEKTTQCLSIFNSTRSVYDNTVSWYYNPKDNTCSISHSKGFVGSYDERYDSCKHITENIPEDADKLMIESARKDFRTCMSSTYEDIY